MESSLAIKASSGKAANEVKKEPQPSTSYASDETYKRRPRTNVSGGDYEYKMLTLLCIRGILKNPEDMWLATNAKDVGDFDDIILNMKTKENPGITYMVQMKHQDLPSEIKNEDFMHRKKPFRSFRTTRRSIRVLESLLKKKMMPFNLIKHAQGFSELKKTLVNTTRSGDIIENLDPDKIVSVFFTNRIAANSGIPYFEKCTNSDLTLLNTRAKNKYLYKFNSITGGALNLTNWDYCRNIYFLSNQVNVTDAEVSIFNEMQKLIKQLGLTTINGRNIAKDFTEYITNWAKSRKNMRYLTKEQVLYKLTDLFISEYAVKFKNEPCAFYNCPTKNIWNRIVDDRIITYVTFDNTAVRFLKEYVGSEVRKYHVKLEDQWDSTLSGDNKKLFFDKNSNLKRAMLNITGEIGTLTMLDVYKCLWLNNKIPVLLVIDNEEQHQDVLNILNRSKLYLKIIIVNKLNLTLSTWLDRKASFVNLNDLNEESRKLILGQSVSLQGRKGHLLGELVNKSMYNFIKCNDIIHILLENYNIGNVYSLTDKYFLERSVYRTLIKFEVLIQIKDELFIIHNEAPKELLINKLRNLNLNYSESNIIVVQCVKEEDIKELKLKHDTIHRLIFYGGNSLEWMESQGQTKHIKKHLVQMNNSHRTIRFYDKICEDVLKNNVLNKTHVFSGYPGMGKSTLIDFISNKAPTNMWVLKITLNDHIELYEMAQSKKTSDYIKYFNKKIINDGSCFNIPLATAVFQKLLTENRILVLMDGFDEVSVTYKDEATKVMKTLHESVHHMWISTRPHMNSYLEEEFDTIAITITPFTLQDQQNFFIKYFTEFIQNSKMHKKHINKFSQKLLKAAQKNLHEWVCKFVEIPLQCKLLADYFVDDLKVSLSQNVINVNEDFNLLQLYEEFINKKRNILCNKYGKYAKKMHKFFDYHQNLLALKILFTKSDLCELDIDLELNNYYQHEKNCMELLQKEGVLVVHEEKQTFSATSVHRTFAEFIAAQWLAENYDSTNSKIKNTVEFLLNTRFSGFYGNKFLFRIFDSLFAKGFPLHSAIINKQIPQIKKMSTSFPEDINKLDKCKRSIVHLIALYSDTNTNYDPTDYKIVNKGNSIPLDQMVDIIEIMPVEQVIDLHEKDSFGYNPLDYAILRKCTPVVDKLCEKSNEIIITVDINEYEDYMNTFHCPYKLNKRIQDLVWKCIERDLYENVSFLLVDMTDEVFSHLKKLGVKTTTDLIEKCNIKSTSGNYYFDLKFAAAFGTVENVNQLLAEGADVNQRVFGYTSLYCAVKKNRPEIVKIFLRKMVEVNTTCLNGNTALHAASEADSGNIAKMLIESGANINQRNNFGETALFFASRKCYIHSVNVLLQNRADVNIMNNGYNTCLHIAAEKGILKVIHKFIQYGTDINISNMKGKTPFFLALENKQIDVANLLIKQDIKVDVTDYGGNSYLHAAAVVGEIDITHLLIEKGLDINKQNGYGETPLFYAFKNGHSNVVKLVFANKVKVDRTNYYNNLCLHYAAEQGETGIVHHMINEDFNINLENDWSETPLLLALKNDHISVVKLLLKNNAKIDRVDCWGNTCLHAAAKVGQSHIMRQLINAGLDVNKQNDSSETPLSLAFENGHINVVELLLKSNAKINSRVDRFGNTYLHAAAKAGQCRIMRQLINAGLDVNKQNNKDETPLSLALENNNTIVAELLLKNNAKINRVDRFGNTYLHAAAKGDQSLTMRQLINAGLDVNKQNDDGETPLLFALDNGHTIVVELLLKNNAKIDGVDCWGNTCLHAAAKAGQSHIMRQLINAGLDVNKQNDSSETPLSLAFENGHINVVELLLKNNAKINNGVDRINNTYLHAAAKAGQSRIMRQLINAGFDVNKQNNFGVTPLSLALENGHISVVELLLTNNAKIDGVDHYGNTCLHAAAKACQSHVMSRLINAGLDVNKQNNTDETPLLIALGHGCLDVAKKLISCGASFNLRTESDSCHLHYAVQGGCLENWIKFLLGSNYMNINDREHDLTVINSKNQTLLHVSVDEIYPESIAKLQDHKRTVNFLLSSDIDVNKTDNQKRTVLHYISDYNNFIGNNFTDDFYANVTTVILNTDIDINAKDINRQTALDLATENQHYKIAFLIQQKSDSVEILE